MFSKARLKLTAWYLLIIMMISLSFSIAIYYGFGLALERRFNEIENRLLGQENRQSQPVTNPLLSRDLMAARRQLLILLIFANGTILVFSAVAGYFLAGRTLKPIEDMIEEQNRFVADASHELRTPIAAMKVSIEVAMRDDKLSLAEAREVIEGNKEDLEHLQKLAEDLLSLAKYQAGSKNLVMEKINIKEIIEHSCSKIIFLAQGKGIALNISADDCYFYGDSLSLEEVMLIFLDNAIKYTPENGTVNISARAENHFITIEIKDSGIGIDKKDLPYIFERFYRADKSRTRLDVSGTGLGLSLARKIIELHRGQVFVSSKLNNGTVFTIKLPAK